MKTVERIAALIILGMFLVGLLRHHIQYVLRSNADSPLQIDRSLDASLP